MRPAKDSLLNGKQLHRAPQKHLETSPKGKTAKTHQQLREFLRGRLVFATSRDNGRRCTLSIWVPSPLPAPGDPRPHIPETKDGNGSGKRQRYSPFSTSSARGNKSPKKGSEFRAGSPPHPLPRCPELSPSQLPQALTSSVATRISESSKAPPSINPPSQPVSDQLLSPSLPRFLPPTQGAFQSRPTQTHPSTTKTKTQASNTRWVLLPPPVPAHFLPGRVGGGRDPLLSGQAHYHSPGAAGRSLTHPEDAAGRGRSPTAGGGSATGRGGAGAGKASCGYRDARPGARPPSPRAPLVPGLSPAPWVRPGSPAPFGLPGPARPRLPLHVRPGCCSRSSLRAWCRPRLQRRPSAPKQTSARFYGRTPIRAHGGAQRSHH